MVDRFVIPVLRTFLWLTVALGMLLTIVILTMETDPDAAYPELSKVIAVLFFAVPTVLACLGLFLVRWWRLRRRDAHTATPLDPSSVWGSLGDPPSSGPVGPPEPAPVRTPSSPESFAPGAPRSPGNGQVDGDEGGTRDMGGNRHEGDHS
ncbi:MAG: hypothetical protein ACTJGR_07555 [Pauljensenia sp.]